MKEKILRIFGSILILTFIGCIKQDVEVECDIKLIQAYAIEKCGTFVENEQCKEEVVYLIATSCGIK